MDHPKVRPLEAFPVVVDGRQMICLHDPTRINEKPMMVNGPTYFLLTLMDGTRDILDIQTDFGRRTGEILFREKVEDLLAQLDQGLLLENDRYREHLRSIQQEFLARPSRPYRHAGLSYPDDPDELAGTIEGLLARFQDSVPELGSDPPVGLIAPHIDFARGADVYGAAYGALRKWGDEVDLYVILGTSHQNLDRGFALSTKDYETPLGTAETDRSFVERLTDRCGSKWFAEEFAHRNEHSIEFQAVCLRHLVPRDQSLRIVPILCGSLNHCIGDNLSPQDDEDVQTFCSALQDTIAETEGWVCVVAGVDLSHMGSRFGGTEQMTPGFLSRLESWDRATLEFVERPDAEGFHRNIAREMDRRNICGHSPIYVLLTISTAQKGYVLRYGQAVDRQTQSVVTFAAALLME